MSSTLFHGNVLELIRRTSAYLPPDVSSAIEVQRALEQAGSKADLALSLVSQNIAIAKQLSAPICQDTGTITFYIKTPFGFDQLELETICNEAVGLVPDVEGMHSHRPVDLGHPLDVLRSGLRARADLDERE